MMRSSEFEFWQQTDHHHQLYGGHYNGTAMNADSPQLWKTAKSRLPYDTRKLKATTDYSSRKEFMEVIRDMPESSYDLSFKDMVDATEKTGHKKERKLPPPMRNRAAGPICRSQSMESEVFLLKMFVSFGSSKKSPRQRKKALSEFIPRPSSGKQRQGARNWWKMMFVSVKDNNNNNRPKIERTTSDVSSNRTSLLVGSSLPCQRSFNEKKFKSRDCKGCLF